MIALVTHRGAVKKMKRSEFELGTRAKRGVVMLRVLKKNPHKVVGIELLDDMDQLVIESEKGKMEEISSFQLRPSDRYSNGSFFMDEAESGPIIDQWVVKAAKIENEPK